MPIKIIKSGIIINDLLKGGFKIHSPSFILFYQLTTQGSNFEFVPIAGKKVFKSAVARNLIKRRIRELVRQVYKSSSKNIKIAVMAKKQLLDVKFSDLVKELNTAYEKI